MAITDVPEFTHLTDADIENLANELDAIRLDIEDSRGERDSRYIRRTIAAQRALEVAGRLMLTASSRRSAWWAGTVTLGVAKIIENMEIGHNVMHGQWDWMNDPEIHSSTWEWDTSGAAKHWRFTHNFMHHKYTNILGMDDDVGYGLIRVTRDAKWKPFNLGNLLYNTILALGFEWGIGLQHVELGKIFKGRDNRDESKIRAREFAVKAGAQVVKDYVAYPALTSLSPGATYTSTLKANAVANVIRNVWSNAVIFCGHFPDGAEKFTKTDMVGESKGQWYLRQMLGSANFNAGPALRFMSGNLSHQIEHHLFPDLPSNRYEEIGVRVRQICDKYDLPYTTGNFLLQYGKSWRTIAKLSLPDKFLTGTRDDAPETRSERMFDELPPSERRGLKSSIAAVRARRREKRALAA
ncbi:stearoyl-CoA 9-desaturase [Mycolicibacterium arabiense]|uniref:Stearoyl-CoA 9-desaturase n=1 Tax=Mycolicibacterium arabiense TaxID=1286181 RepID=A0A7I7RYU0_9MYCO|nr:fatty acid desaturase [Mycolicibacterium arabiense]MCV7373670.1 fatty acid desaturase [Mycolicibacterium arabiense]BBY48915.1 stearoyl-CoA 9-desaturase [Mycolicibacterium arabiense]